MFKNFQSIIKGKAALSALVLCGASLSTVSAQTCPPIITYKPAGVWSAPTPNPAPYGPYNNCGNTDGRTTHFNAANDHGFYTEYDGTPTWNWARNVTGLDPNKTYQVYIHMETENTYHKRHLIFNYNLAGQTGTYTTAGDPSGTSIGRLQTFNVTGKTSLNFTGNIHDDAYQGCEQTQELRFNLAVMEVITTNIEAPTTNTFVVRNNFCPSQMLDLTGVVTSTCAPGSTLEWHTSNVPSASNLVSNPSSVPETPFGQPYYAFCHKSSPNCYSPASSRVFAIPNECQNILNDDEVNASLNFGFGTGYLSNNDILLPGTTFGQPAESYPGIELILNADGNYFYNAIAPGTYVFNIPVCAQGMTSGCPTEKLTINVAAARPGTTAVLANTPEKAFVFPNPVSGNNFNFVYENYTLTDKAPLNIQMTDMSGRVVYNSNEMITTGVNKVQVHANNLSKGIYYFNYTNPELKINGKLKVVVN